MILHNYVIYIYIHIITLHYIISYHRLVCSIRAGLPIPRRVGAWPGGLMCIYIYIYILQMVNSRAEAMNTHIRYNLMYIYIYTYICMYVSIHLSIYLYIYLSIYLSPSLYIYIYIYIV